MTLIEKQQSLQHPRRESVWELPMVWPNQAQM